MIRKITLKNFMSHAETVIDLADGLTVLTGPNNCGKSALVAALQTLATNGRTTHVTRHGEKTASVIVETSEGDCVQWERKKNTVKYVINGEDIHRVGQGIPEELHDVLKLDRVDLGTGSSSDRYDIHFGEQKSPVFLLGDSGRRAAEFFASSSDASRLMQMLELHRSEIRDQKKEKKSLEEESTKNIARLDALRPLQEIDQQVSEARAIEAEFTDRATAITRLEALISSIGSKKRECRTLQETCRLIDHLDQATTSPTKLQSRVDHAVRLEQLINDIQSTARLIHEQTEQQEAMADLQTPPNLELTGNCHRLIGRLRHTKKTIESLRETCKLTGRLVAPPALQDARLLKNSVERIRTTEKSVTSLRLASQTLKGLKSVDPPVDLARLNRVVTELYKQTESLKTAAEAACNADKELKKCENKIKAFVESNPKCAVCGGNLDPEMLMSAAPASHDHSRPSGLANGGATE